MPSNHVLRYDVGQRAYKKMIDGKYLLGSFAKVENWGLAGAELKCTCLDCCDWFGLLEPRSMQLVFSV